MALMFSTAWTAITFAPFRSADFTGPPRLETISGGRAFSFRSTSSKPCRVCVSATDARLSKNDNAIPQGVVRGDRKDVVGHAFVRDAHGFSQSNAVAVANLERPGFARKLGSNGRNLTPTQGTHTRRDIRGEGRPRFFRGLSVVRHRGLFKADAVAEVAVLHTPMLIRYGNSRRT